jgi:hypothetical protein
MDRRSSSGGAQARDRICTMTPFDNRALLRYELPLDPHQSDKQHYAETLYGG